MSPIFGHISLNIGLIDMKQSANERELNSTQNGCFGSTYFLLVDVVCHSEFI
jgi:hypothetical protein